MSTDKPQILNVSLLAKTRIFMVEGVDLAFSNGEERQFERIKSRRDAVLIIPQQDDETFFLIKEYATGIESYELGFPKGLVDPGETLFEAANRELKEEVGYGARSLEFVRTVTLSPSYMEHKTHLIFAHDLYPEKLEGDEPEPIELVPWSWQNLDALLARDDFTDARCVAALLLIQKQKQAG